MTDFGKI